MMTKITKTRNLQQDIEILQISTIAQKKQLIESVNQKIESLKPRNLVKSSLKNFQSKPSLNKGLIITATGLGSFLLAQRLVKKNKKKGLLKLLISTMVTIVVRKTLEGIKARNKVKIK